MTLTRKDLDDVAARYDAYAEDMRAAAQWHDAQIAEEIKRAHGPFDRPAPEPWNRMARTRTPYEEMILCERWGIKP